MDKPFKEDGRFYVVIVGLDKSGYHTSEHSFDSFEECVALFDNLGRCDDFIFIHGLAVDSEIGNVYTVHPTGEENKCTE